MDLTPLTAPRRARGVAGFGFYLPAIGLLLSVFVVLLVGVCNAPVARRLFQLARR